MSGITFIHTADWQLGKPFAMVENGDKRAALRRARIAVIERIGELVKQRDAEFVLVAGDLFDSTTVDKSTVSAACDAIGRIGVPVLAIPGNHDHGGPGSIWEQAFFRREQEALAPNLSVLLAPEPVRLDRAVILPCPLLRRATIGDPTAWLRAPEVLDALPAGLPRIVLAHGAVQRFVSTWEDEEDEVSSSNLLHPEELEAVPMDYVALGDWHGTLQVGVRTWYAGTPEPDRFPRGEDQDPGNVLVVRAARGEAPPVERVRTAGLAWRRVHFRFTDDESLLRFERMILEELGDHAAETVLRLELEGSLGIQAYSRLEELLDSLASRLAWMKRVHRVEVAPTPAEIVGLRDRPEDPLIAGVAAALIARAESDEDPRVAQLALRLLHAVCREEEGR
jgi:DNA repair exonuclease SbcCD nuclease subunit